LSEVKGLVRERVQLTVQLKVSLWRLGDWCEMATSLGPSCQLRGSYVQEAVKKRVSCKSVVVKRRLFVWYLLWVIQWDCYSSCVNSLARKWVVQTVIDWEH
jgi:hypothetical protein